MMWSGHRRIVSSEEFNLQKDCSIGHPRRSPEPVKTMNRLYIFFALCAFIVTTLAACKYYLEAVILLLYVADHEQLLLHSANVHASRIALSFRYHHTAPAASKNRPLDQRQQLVRHAIKHSVSHRDYLSAKMPRRRMYTPPASREIVEKIRLRCLRSLELLWDF